MKFSYIFTFLSNGNFPIFTFFQEILLFFYENFLFPHFHIYKTNLSSYIHIANSKTKRGQTPLFLAQTRRNKQTRVNPRFKRII